MISQLSAWGMLLLQEASQPVGWDPISMWTAPSDDERLIAGNRAFADAMRPFGTGAAYLNFTPEADRVRTAYGDEKYERLVALKDKYDPENLFRLNQNIEPSRGPAEPALT